MRKFIILTVLLISLGIGYYYFKIDTPRIVSVIQPSKGEIESVIRLTGKVLNDRTVTMTALVDGQIQEVLVRIGDSVNSGQVLALLDHQEAEAQYQSKLAELELQKETLQELSRKSTELNGVFKTGGATQQEVKEARAAERLAQIHVKVAENRLNLESVRKNKLRLIAPFSGIITEREIEIGQWVEAGTKLLTLVAQEGREVELDVDAGDSSTIKIGQRVKMSSESWDNISWEEKIVRIFPSVRTEADNKLNTFSVRVSLGKNAPPLLLGQQVDSQIVTATKTNIVMLPFQALIEEDRSPKVAVVSNNKVFFTSVKLGIENLTHVEIVAGLDGDENIILSNGEAYYEGEVVQINQE